MVNSLNPPSVYAVILASPIPVDPLNMRILSLLGRDVPYRFPSNIDLGLLHYRLGLVRPRRSGRALVSTSPVVSSV